MKILNLILIFTIILVIAGCGFVDVKHGEARYTSFSFLQDKSVGKVRWDKKSTNDVSWVAENVAADAGKDDANFEKFAQSLNAQISAYKAGMIAGKRELNNTSTTTNQFTALPALK